MLQYENIQKAMGIDIAMSQDMANAIYRWNKMYVNKAPWIGKDVKSLQLPAAISSEMARLVTNEAQVTISGSTRADTISELLQKFFNKLMIYTEFGCAGGGVVFKPYPCGNTIAVDVVKAGNCYPVEFDSADNLTGAIFPEFIKKGKKLYTRLEYQSLQGDRYIIQNRAFLSTKAIIRTDNIINLGQEINLSDIPEWEDVAPEVEFRNADRALFSYFKIPIANNTDPESPLGVSVFARAEELIRDADEQYGATLWEYRSKETAIQAADEFFLKTRKGEPMLPKGKERIYHAMGKNVMDNDGKPFFNVYSPEIRDQSFFNGYNKIVQKIEFNSGLAYGTLSDPQMIEKTAEEIKASKQRSYSTVKSIQNSLQDAIKNLVYAVDGWMNIENMAPSGRIDIACNWDDSLIVDKKYELEQMRMDVAMGAMALWEYRMKVYGETEEQAKANVPPVNTQEVMM